MNIRKAFVLSVGGIVGAGSIMFVAAKELQINLSNAIQHITTVVISTGGNRATLSSDTAGNLNVDTNNFIIGSGNTINESANGSAIMGGSGNVISGGKNNAILTGESNQISGTNQVIGGGKNNTITAGQNSVIVGGESNTVSAMNSVIIGNNSNVGGANNITIGQNNKVLGQNNVVMGSGGQTSAQSGFLWAGGKGQGVSGAFVVYANSGMAVNTSAVAGFAKVSIGAPLIVSTGDTASIECNSEYVGTLKLVKKYGNDENSDFKNQMCLCSCNASGWTSLGGNKQCDVPCKNESEFYNPSTNDVDGICGSGLLLQNGTYTGNACLSGYKLIMDSFVLKGERKDYKAVLYWSCQKDEGKTKSCSQSLDNYKCVKNDSYKVFSGDMGLIPVHAHWNNNILPNKSVSVQYTGNKSALCSFSCNDGYTWVDDNGYDCKKQCTGFDGRKVDHGQILTGYSSANPICNTACQERVFKCVDGNWQLNGQPINLKDYSPTCQTQTGRIVMPGERNKDDAECTTSQNQGTETTIDQGSEMVDDEMRVDTRVDVAPSASEQSASSMGVYPGASSTAQNNINPLAGESSAGLAPIGMDPLPIGNGLGPVQPTDSQYTAGVCKLQASNDRIQKVFSGGAKPSDTTTSYLSLTCKQYNANGMSCETGVVQELYVCKTGHHWEGNKCVKDTCPATTLKGTGIYSVSTGDVCTTVKNLNWTGTGRVDNKKYECVAAATCTSAGWKLKEECVEIKKGCPNPIWEWGTDEQGRCINGYKFNTGVGYSANNIKDFVYECKRSGRRSDLASRLFGYGTDICYGECPSNMKWNTSKEMCTCESNKVWNESSCVCDEGYFLNENGECEEIPDDICYDLEYSKTLEQNNDAGNGCIPGAKLSQNAQWNTGTQTIKWRCEGRGKRQDCSVSCDVITENSTLHNAYCANPDPLCGTGKGTCINGGTLSGNINTNNNIHTWTCKKGTQSQSCGCEVLVEGNGICPEDYKLQSDGRCKYMPKYCAYGNVAGNNWIALNQYCFGYENTGGYNTNSSYPNTFYEYFTWYNNENNYFDFNSIRMKSLLSSVGHHIDVDDSCGKEVKIEKPKELTYQCKLIKGITSTPNNSVDNGFYLDCTGNDLFTDPCPGAQISDWPVCGGLLNEDPILSCQSKLTVNPNGGKAIINDQSYNSQSTVTQDCGRSLSLTATRDISINTGTYTVTFNGNGGIPSTQSKSSTFTKTTTYNFSGWNDSGTCGTMNGTTYTFPQSDGATCTKTAQWSSGTTSSAGSITLPSATRSGYTFLYWYTSGGDRVGGSGENYTPKGNITLYAQWSKNPAQCKPTTVTYNGHKYGINQTGNVGNGAGGIQSSDFENCYADFVCNSNGTWSVNKETCDCMQTSTSYGDCWYTIPYGSNGEMFYVNTTTTSLSGSLKATCNNGTWDFSNKSCSKKTYCGGLPEKASWQNPMFNQTWNGVSWNPTTKTPTFTTDSSIECGFLCNSPYEWNGSSCELIEGYKRACRGYCANKENITGNEKCYDKKTANECSNGFISNGCIWDNIHSYCKPDILQDGCSNIGTKDGCNGTCTRFEEKIEPICIKSECEISNNMNLLCEVNADLCNNELKPECG